MKTYRYLKQNLFTNNFLLLSLICLLRFKIFASSHLIGFILFSFCFLVLYLSDKSSRIKISLFILFIWFIILGIVFWYISRNPSGNGMLYHTLMFSCPVLYFMTTYFYIENMSQKDFILSLKKISKIVIIYLIAEVIFRIGTLVFKILHGESLLMIYVYLKELSFAYSDVNFVGLFILVIFCLELYLYQTTKEPFFKKCVKILFILGFTSVSRSVMLTMLSIFYIIYFYKQYKKGHFVFVIINILLIPIGIFVLYNLLQADASFRSKIGIIEGIKRIWTKPIENQLFGYGYGIGEYMYSYREGDFGHLHIALFLGQIGIIGIFITLVLFLHINVLSYNKASILIFAFLLSGCSLAFYDSSLFYALAVITGFEKKIKNKGICYYGKND